MAEKGGKGHSLPGKAAKSSLKSTTPNGASAKGKDDGSGKPKKGRKVQFDSEVNLGKGGKGDKTGRAAKSSAPKEQPPLELRVEQELPKHAKCLMDCEAAEILQGIQEQMVVLSEDPTVKIPV
ncbi:DNA-directed RNA polymerases IV and V subunit 4-like isoform X1 [Eucalyptus grandis]|uniref:DNA-directed RNA polymerases IV and V subunit 4-like isoform X1 n=1 Tax=Eucalyptus grandis TaxID=71139 RepID=UPI00192EE8B3|nr:DNA-directed RNA polymerases IV and V subunit 4-like isoform X1 [Eucalyptus grandis]